MVGDEVRNCLEQEVAKSGWHEVPEGTEINNGELCKCKGHGNCGCKTHLSKRKMEKESERIDKIVSALTEDTDIVAHEALRRYFVRLSQYGYYDYESVYRLMALIMIDEFREEFSCFWNKKDESVIERVLDCLYCSICAIPRPDRFSDTSLSCTNATRKDYIQDYDNDIIDKPEEEPEETEDL